MTLGMQSCKRNCKCFNSYPEKWSFIFSGAWTKKWLKKIPRTRLIKEKNKDEIFWTKFHRRFSRRIDYRHRLPSTRRKTDETCKKSMNGTLLCMRGAVDQKNIKLMNFAADAELTLADGSETYLTADLRSH
jgi:hypothetical protein